MGGGEGGLNTLTFLILFGPLNVFKNFVVLFITANGLKCYTCSSTSSMDDCKSKQKEADCPADSYRCGEVSMEYNDIKTYAKNCMPKATCDNSDVFSKECKAASGDTCSLDCCEGDLCNGDTVPMVSVLVMVACALMALFC